MRNQLSLATRPIFAQTPDQQEVVDLVIKAAKPIDELRDKLGIQ